MNRNVKVLMTNALFCTLLCLPTIGSADHRTEQTRGYMDKSGAGMSDKSQDMNRDKQQQQQQQQQPQSSATTGYPTPTGQNQYSRADWMYPQHISKAEDYQMNFNQDFQNRHDTKQAKGWDSQRNYSRSSNQDWFARDGQHFDPNAKYFPGNSYYSRGADFNGDGFVSPAERRMYRQEYYSSNYGYPSSYDSGFSSYPSYSYDFDGSLDGYDAYPYSQYYYDSGMMDDGFYYNFR